jgi:hypothetical protein
MGVMVWIVDCGLWIVAISEMISEILDSGIELKSGPRRRRSWAIRDSRCRKGLIGVHSPTPNVEHGVEPTPRVWPSAWKMAFFAC